MAYFCITWNNFQSPFPTNLRMYCIDTEALVFMFNGGSPYGLTIHPIFTRICMLYTNHINNEKHVHHGFLAPRPYLCSTSLRGNV